jgi:RNA polymerase sigma-70 factor (ECF subfamily)
MLLDPDLVTQLADPNLPETRRAAAEREVCQKLAPRIRLYGLRHLRDEAASADLVQEALIALLRSAREGKIEEPAHVERFVLGTCRNLVLRQHRRERRQKAFEGALLPLAEQAMPPAFASADSARLAFCMGQLPRREQRVVLLTFQEERSADEIASEMATSAGNVRVLRHRAMAALQRCVDGGDP